MSVVQGSGRGRGNWLRESEHVVLMVVSLVFSVGSAYQVRWFFEPLDSGDPIHYVLWWIVSAGFGLLGFYLSRSLMHRMMSKEPMWVYVPLFLLIEFFEVSCNYMKAVSVVSSGNVVWIMHAPAGQQGVIAFLTYVGWSILPLVSPLMAVVDMDMTRRRAGEVGSSQLNRPVVATSQGARVQPGSGSAARPGGLTNGQRPAVAQPQQTVQNGAARPGGQRPAVAQPQQTVQNGAARPGGPTNGQRPVASGAPSHGYVNVATEAGPGGNTVKNMNPLQQHYAQRGVARDEYDMAMTLDDDDALDQVVLK